MFICLIRRETDKEIGLIPVLGLLKWWIRRFSGVASGGYERGRVGAFV